ncbi:hypothetical protein ACF06W_11375 [Streptomyces albus]|uniref:hypothetical protein n=1 Tax=Streptomyces albus TaxID=1888 RepID=UPI0036FC5065
MQTRFVGANLARQLSEVRTLQVFRIDAGYTRRRVGLNAVWADAASGLAWIEAHNGSWRLPPDFLPWALEVEEHAAAVVGHTAIFPCQALFEVMPDGSWEVEIFPHK